MIVHKIGIYGLWCVFARYGCLASFVWLDWCCITLYDFTDMVPEIMHTLVVIQLEWNYSAYYLILSHLCSSTRFPTRPVTSNQKQTDKWKDFARHWKETAYKPQKMKMKFHTTDILILIHQCNIAKSGTKCKVVKSIWYTLNKRVIFINLESPSKADLVARQIDCDRVRCIRDVCPINQLILQYLSQNKFRWYRKIKTNMGVMWLWHALVRIKRQTALCSMVVGLICSICWYYIVLFEYRLVMIRILFAYPSFTQQNIILLRSLSWPLWCLNGFKLFNWTKPN